MLAIATKVWGPNQGRRIVDALRRVESWEVSRAHKPVFRSSPWRLAQERAIRRCLALLVSVCERMNDGGRAMSPSLWIGHGREGRWGLAWRVGVSSSEISRYLVVLRAAGILDSWQPDASTLRDRYPRLVGRRTGHAYRCYQWAVGGEMPREMVELLHRVWQRGRSTMTRALAAVSPPREANPESVSEFARYLPPS